MSLGAIIVCSIIGLILLYVIGVYLFDFIAGRIDRKHPSKLTPDEQRAADYAAYKAKQG